MLMNLLRAPLGRSWLFKFKAVSFLCINIGHVFVLPFMIEALRDLVIVVQRSRQIHFCRSLLSSPFLWTFDFSSFQDVCLPHNLLVVSSVRRAFISPGP